MNTMFKHFLTQFVFAVLSVCMCWTPISLMLQLPRSLLKASRHNSRLNTTSARQLANFGLVY